ncbi:metal ABC transporter permease [Spirochaeta thermophila]|uniref:ABC transporter n=1 Tax=Winmispira thermophila (strain ATCC 49972 / DSM 6192 / RI 19.B1) TaxID=665571 RepID=E0RR03_WINT6|nr:metal ABC transporter permease [Spirochaeta thermophila]ADN01581.1 ABC transporter [Spirochaeta thermophila DSM 6192]
MIELLSLGFVQRAFLTGLALSLPASLLGMFLILRRFSMVGDGLAHVSFATVALGLLVGTQPFILSLPLVVAASLLLLFLVERRGAYGDAAVGMISGAAVALGVVLASVAGGFNVDLFAYLFGSILTVTWDEVWMSLLWAAVVVAGVVVWYRPLFMVTYDPEFAQVQGLPVRRYERILMVATAVTVVLGIRLVGVLLISSLIVFPASCAFLLRKGFAATLTVTALVGVGGVFLGMTASLAWNLPTGPAIVLAYALVFLLLALIPLLSRAVRGRS